MISRRGFVVSLTAIAGVFIMPVKKVLGFRNDRLRQVRSGITAHAFESGSSDDYFLQVTEGWNEFNRPLRTSQDIDYAESLAFLHYARRGQLSEGVEEIGHCRLMVIPGDIKAHWRLLHRIRKQR